MNKIVEFLNEAEVYYLATVEDDEARIRPIGATIEYDDKVYFATNNQKKMFQQMIINPSIAISGVCGDKWIRIIGKAVFDHNYNIKKAMIEAYPILNTYYSPDDGLFEVFYVDEMEATVYNFEGKVIEQYA